MKWKVKRGREEVTVVEHDRRLVTREGKGRLGWGKSIPRNRAAEGRRARGQRCR